MTRFAPVDDNITIEQLTLDPYPIYRRLRAQQPVLTVKAAGRTLLTRAEDTRHVKDHPEQFSSNDPDTPMKRAFLAHTLMRKDAAEHRRERMAMAPSLAPRVVRDVWAPRYTRYAAEYVGSLPRGETIDLFEALCGPLAARILADIMGIPQASDHEMQQWSQALINGAGNFAWKPEPFAISDQANLEMDQAINSRINLLRSEPDQSALSTMINAENPIPMSQIISNIKIAIGGGINEPRDAMATAVFGLLTNPDQLTRVKSEGCWKDAFEEAIRWVAPIQVSSRLVLEDTEIRGCLLPQGETVMTVQASANHDEELFESPEQFNVFRVRKPHQAFGNGPHHCAGTHVARGLVAGILMPMLFDRFPNMTLPDSDGVKWRGFGFRGPVNLPVRLL
ncbi:cytochrome [Chromatiales bacterium (ex Bugula neritina AB1)]|nr:cytochrome [Chromatiales bacterium (ex Bugula neritina AB1)]